MAGGFYRHYLVVVLMVIMAFNFVDRQALGLLMQDIKVDLDLTDTQLGILSGIAFALFYSVLGIPIARWADRGNRVTIITVTTALWSAAVVLCGMAASFVQLLLVRIGVAVGEAGCMPPAHSLIADSFPRAERPRATAIYMLGAPLSAIIGYFLAGWLNELYGWRITFILLGAPGLALAVLAWLTLREPRDERRKQEQDVAKDPATPHGASLRIVATTLWRNRTFRHLLFAFSIMHFFGHGIGQWQPAFFIRSFGLETGELGTWLAVIWGGGGLLGTYLGGALASRYAANQEVLQLRTMAIVFCGFGVIWSCVYLSHDKYLAFALLGLAAIGISTTMGPLFATIQTVVPAEMRATSIAALYFFGNLIGMGLGPLAAGALSDGLRPLFAEESLRYALLALCPGYLWAGWHLWRGSATVIHDLQAGNMQA